MATDKKTEASKTLHTLTLTNGAIAGLRMLLSSPAWHKDDPEAVRHAYRAGQLLEDVLPDKFPTFKPEENEQAVAWEKGEAAPIQVSEKHRDTCKKAVEWGCKNGALANGKHKNRLIDQLGLTPTE